MATLSSLRPALASDLENSMELLLGHSPIHMAEQLFKDDPQDGDALIDISEDSHIFFGQQEHNPVE